MLTSEPFLLPFRCPARWQVLLRGSDRSRGGVIAVRDRGRRFFLGFGALAGVCQALREIWRGYRLKYPFIHVAAGATINHDFGIARRSSARLQAHRVVAFAVNYYEAASVWFGSSDVP